MDWWLTGPHVQGSGVVSPCQHHLGCPVPPGRHVARHSSIARRSARQPKVADAHLFEGEGRGGGRVVCCKWCVCVCVCVCVVRVFELCD